MAIKKTSKPNTQSPTSTYPYGRLQDKILNVQPGTPLNRQTHEDFHEFFERLMDLAGITPNDLRENGDNGWQFIEALGRFDRANDVFYNGYVTRSINSIGLGDLGRPIGCSADPETGVLYVADTASGNERVFAYDINSGSRLTSREWSAGTALSGILVHNDVAYYSLQNSSGIFLYIRDIAAGSNINSILVYDANELEYLLSNQQHFPDLTVDLRGEKVYLTKGGVGDDQVRDALCRVVDISDLSNLSVVSSEEISGTSDEAFASVELVKGQEPTLSTGGTVVALADYFNGNVELYRTQSGASPIFINSFSTPVTELISLVKLGDFLVSRGYNIPNHFTNLGAGYAESEVRKFTLSSTSSIDREGRMATYHRDSVDDNGYRNHKVFVVDGTPSVEVWLQELPSRSIR